MRHFLRVTIGRLLAAFLLSALLLLGMLPAARADGNCPKFSTIIASSSYTLSPADNCTWIFLSAPGTIAIKLPPAGLAFPAGHYEVSLYPSGGGSISVTAMADADRNITRFINGATSLSLGAGQTLSLRMGEDSNWYGIPGTTLAGSSAVNNGIATQLGYYAATGTAISGNPDALIAGGALTVGIAGSVQGSLILSGATSGTETLGVPATASGTITFPAGTTNFSATGGANQVVQQISAGGPLTVAQLGFLALSGQAAFAQLPGSAQITVADEMHAQYGGLEGAFEGALGE